MFTNPFKPLSERDVVINRIENTSWLSFIVFATLTGIYGKYDWSVFLMLVSVASLLIAIFFGVQERDNEVFHPRYFPKDEDEDDDDDRKPWASGTVAR